MIDSNKFGRASLLTIARAEELDAVVTDDGLDEGTAEEFRAAGVPARDRKNLGGGKRMARPVTLFTGQWADLSLEQLAGKVGEWEFDGLELACWGDHFDVAEALSTPRTAPAGARSSSATG